jgi:hypothetical protein
LPIDILKDKVKKDLLYISSQNLERVFSELLTHKNPYSDMRKNGNIIFLQLLKETLNSFLIKQYGSEMSISIIEFRNSLYINTLLKDIDILFKVPFYALLNPTSSEFLLIYYPLYTYASESFLEALITNLVIEVANCVVYHVITNFPFLQSFRQNLYRSKFLSLRNFERFKNNLIWQLRVNVYINRPTLFYNSLYFLLLLRTKGIYNKTIYANRSQELANLTNMPLLTVTLIEFKDFFISRLEESLYLISKGLRFTLISIIGQGIGLVWRGIIEGFKKITRYLVKNSVSNRYYI